jgi:hypothetical protein
MSQIPEPYNRQHPFGAASSNNPSNPIQGTDLDAEFNAVEVALDETQARLAEIQRDDGKLKNQSVGMDQLAPDVVTYVTDLAEDAAQGVIDSGIGEITQIKDQAVAARDEAEGFASAASASASASAASATASQISADDSETEAIQSAASADLSRFYYDQLADAVDALAPLTVVLNGNAAQASYELPRSISDEEFLDVFINGLVVNPSQYAVVGSTLTFTPPPATGTANVLVKVASSVQIMPLVGEDWGFVYEASASFDDWGEVA